jgi:4-hydroxy-3-polyprenylbenzoate decarboxylase
MVRGVVVGVTGASGTAYGVRVLELLRDSGVETDLIVTASGQVTRELETGISRTALYELATRVHRPSDLSAAISSGSYKTLGMIVAPCSVHTLAEIATGVTTNLLTRAAEVTLKERRPLVLLVRETPLTLTHLRNMVTVTENGAVVAPPVPALYIKPRSIDDLVTFTAARALDLLGLDIDIPRWLGPGTASDASANSHKPMPT